MVNSVRDYNWFAQLAQPVREVVQAFGSDAGVSCTVSAKNGCITHVNFHLIGPLHGRGWSDYSHIEDVDLNADRARILPAPYITWLLWRAVDRLLRD